MDDTQTKTLLNRIKTKTEGAIGYSTKYINQLLDRVWKWINKTKSSIRVRILKWFSTVRTWVSKANSMMPRIIITALAILALRIVMIVAIGEMHVSLLVKLIAFALETGVVIGIVKYFDRYFGPKLDTLWLTN